MKLEGKKAYLYGDGDTPPRSGVVVAKEDFNKGPDETRVVVSFWGGPQAQVESFLLKNVTIEIPASEVPQPWRRILEGNRDNSHIERVGVCYDVSTHPVSTTLFHRGTGQRLTLQTEESTRAQLNYWESDGEYLCAKKEEVINNQVEYKVGSIRLSIEEITQVKLSP